MISGGLDNIKTNGSTIRLSIIPDKNKNYKTGFSESRSAIQYSNQYKHYGEGKNKC